MDLIVRYGKRFGLGLLLLTVVDLALLAARLVITGSSRYSFIPWNLALAWLSLLLAGFLVSELRRRRWLSWQNLILTVGWVVLLPNTWYVLTDLVHVFPNGEISQLYDIVLIFLMVLTAFVMGFAGLFLIHRELLGRVSLAKSWLFIEAVVLISSFAIYLGRDLRWNSWDVITNPGGVLVNVSDKIVDPLGNPRALNVTLLFFVLINAIYGAFWLFSQPPKKGRH
ncbi:MAG: DUF1361 domain-containing protein [Candidatus Angelobacter sp.]